MSNLRDETFWDGPSQEPLMPKQGKRTRGKPTTKAERVETRGRARALQALYAADVRGDQTELRRIATTGFDDLAIEPGERAFASRIVATVADRGVEGGAAVDRLHAQLVFAQVVDEQLADRGVVVIEGIVVGRDDAGDAGGRVGEAVDEGDGALDDLAVVVREQVDGLAQLGAAVVEAAHAPGHVGLGGQKAKVDVGGTVGIE